MTQPVAPPAGRQTAAGHAEERGDQGDIGEELKENDGGGEPTDARQLEKQDEEADEEKIEPRKPNRGRYQAGVTHAPSPAEN